MNGYLPKIGGAQVCTHCLATCLSKMGHNVIVYTNKKQVRDCRRRGWRFNYTLKDIDPPYQGLYHLPWLWLDLIKSTMNRRVISDKLDVVQIVFAWPWLAAAKEVKKSAGVPILVRCAGDDIQIDNRLGYGIRRRQIIRELLEGGFAALDRAIAISKTVTNEYIKAGVSKDKIVEIPPGVDIEAFNNCKIDKGRIRNKWGIPIDKKLIISIGRDHPKKGFGDLLKSLAILNSEKSEYAVCIVGKGSDNLVKEAKDIGIGEFFFPISELTTASEGAIGSFPAPELIELYKASDYFVLPSYIETYANVALEAMAAGIPVIVTDAPGCIDTVTDGEDGFIVPVNSPREIAKKILLLEEDRHLKTKIVEAGMKKARNQDWNKIAYEHLKVYSECEEKSR